MEEKEEEDEEKEEIEEDLSQLVPTESETPSASERDGCPSFLFSHRQGRRLSGGAVVERASKLQGTRTTGRGVHP